MPRPFLASLSCWIRSANRLKRLARSIEGAALAFEVAILAFTALLGCLVLLILMVREILKLLGFPLG
jgi:hypothetical protein